MKGKRILIDTSVWIDYFRKKDSALHEKVDEIIEYAEVWVPKVVIAELIQGAKSEKEVAIIKLLLETFQIIEEERDTWLKAGTLSYSMKRKGATVSLVDCYIAQQAIENRCTVFSFDGHFSTIGKYANVELFQYPVVS